VARRPPATPLRKRILIDANGCWNWLGEKTSGYAVLRRRWGGRDHKVRVQRLAWGLRYGFPDPDLVTDHLCRNRGCVNPDHLRLVTSGENTRAGDGPTARNARKTHCQDGHEFTVENTAYSRSGRYCRECNRTKCAAYYRTRNLPAVIA
jgi:hypothetical protein